MHADRAAAAKAKAEAKARAQQEAKMFVPVEQRKLPSPIKRCPKLEEMRMNLLHKVDRKVCIAPHQHNRTKCPMFCTVDKWAALSPVPV